MIVITCPGQGSQKPGFLAPWLDDPNAHQWLTEISAAIGVDLVTHGTVSDADTIRDTAIAQPLIVAAGILAINELRRQLSPAQFATLAFAGHSVGEITAAYGAGIFDAATAMRFVTARSAAMQRCANAAATSMAAVLGADSETLAPHLKTHQLTIANHNGAGQLVVGGPQTGIAGLVAAPPEKTRVVQLQVAGAFHTAAMAAARDELAQLAQNFPLSDPQHRIYTNADGRKITSGSAYLQLLIAQVANPVRWDLCMQQFQQDHITALVEVAPSGALAGLARRSLKGVPNYKIDTPADAASVAAALENTLAN